MNIDNVNNNNLDIEKKLDANLIRGNTKEDYNSFNDNPTMVLNIYFYKMLNLLCNIYIILYYY